MLVWYRFEIPCIFWKQTWYVSEHMVGNFVGTFVGDSIGINVVGLFVGFVIRLE